MKTITLIGMLALALCCHAAPYPFRGDERAPRSIRISDETAFTLDKNNCRIVIGKNPSPVVRYAAGELKHALDRILGAEIPITEEPVKGMHNLFLGDTFATASGADRSRICRDGVFVRTVGGDCYLWGVTARRLIRHARLPEGCGISFMNAERFLPSTIFWSGLPGCVSSFPAKSARSIRNGIG